MVFRKDVCEPILAFWNKNNYLTYCFNLASSLEWFVLTLQKIKGKAKHKLKHGDISDWVDEFKLASSGLNMYLWRPPLK